MTPLLDIRGLKVEVDGKEILKGIDLTINPGEVHAIMGPNGSGKSTLAYIMTGREGYEPTAGSVTTRSRSHSGRSAPDAYSRRSIADAPSTTSRPVIPKCSPRVGPSVSTSTTLPARRVAVIVACTRASARSAGATRSSNHTSMIVRPISSSAL